MKTIVFGFDTPIQKRTFKVLESPAHGLNNAGPIKTPHRWVLDTTDEKPRIYAQHQVSGGDWVPVFGFGHDVESMLDGCDTLDVYGDWRVGGIQAALAECKSILGL